MLGRGTIFLEQLLCRVVFSGFLQPLDCDIALFVKPPEVCVGFGYAVVKVARKRIADKVDAVKDQLTIMVINVKAYTRGPPAMTDTSMAPQLRRPVTNTSSNAASM